ncbi:MAG: HlyD family efflux transporter periplasmic adaptor subunit [Parasphingorhabdus sp.]|nr:HlyD family efflux transporter periplasmic adaptor subunit [Parasphingorhabdus sp.]
MLFAVDDQPPLTARSAGGKRPAIARAQSVRAAARTALTTAQQQLSLYGAVEDPRAISRAELIDRQGAVRAAQSQVAQADADIRSAQAARASAQTDLSRLIVRAPIAAEILTVNVRSGEYVSTGGQQGGSASPFMEIGNTRPKHVRIDIDENEIARVKIGSEAIVSPRGDAGKRVTATFVRAEPLVTPKISLTNSATERVDVRVLQLIYQLPADDGFFVGQQVDAFVRANTVEGGKTTKGSTAR